MSSQQNEFLHIPSNWTAQQAWAIVELLDIISGSIWDTYEDKLLDHARRKASPQYDPSGNEPRAPSTDSTKNRDNDLPF